jgi:hypothetical protein
MSIEYSLEEIIDIVKGILGRQGPQPIQVLGQYLQQETDPSISGFLKRKYKGLKAVLETKPETFRVEGTPPSLSVSLRQGGPGGSPTGNQQQHGARGVVGSMAGSSSATVASSSAAAQPGLRPYLERARAAIQASNWNYLAESFRVFGGVMTAFADEDLRKMPLRQVTTTCASFQLNAWESFIVQHLQVYQLWRAKNHKDAYEAQKRLLLALAEAHPRDQPDKPFPRRVIGVAMADLRLLARWADVALKLVDRDDSLLQAAAQEIRSVVASMVARGSPIERYRAGVHGVNIIMKAYFQLNTVSNCKQLLLMCRSHNYPVLTSCSAADFVTFKFYLGRLHLLAGEYTNAAKVLFDAFCKCTKRKIKNKRLILLYLVPARALLGIMPTNALLQKYRLTQFEDLLQAVKRGDVGGFNRSMQQHKEFFCAKGIYLILEKLRILTFRNFVKRVHQITKQDKFRLEQLVSLLVSTGAPVEVDEVECFLANLIAMGYIKGYISHAAKALVVSPVSSAPPLKFLARFHQHTEPDAWADLDLQSSGAASGR